ncbi:hypothetical protein [Leptolyngbya sp. FACHB-16]|uniref:hypothetical protein n=1 Tax=unclassified Leptolyngbya TaxID=2650499 RepID=UPI001A7E8221|nr:hypothetical protein [Leptolyngbya sp. FACHB-16]
MTKVTGILVTFASGKHLPYLPTIKLSNEFLTGDWYESQMDDDGSDGWCVSSGFGDRSLNG